MKPVHYALLIATLSGWPMGSQAQYPPLPKLLINRRANVGYMDSLARLAKQRYQELTALPQTADTDTLRFKTLHYLGGLYRWWHGRRDSTVYFGNELVNQARQRQNLFYEINGKLVLEDYYRVGQLNTPRALRLNVDILNQLPKTAFYDLVRYRVWLNLGDLSSFSGDYASALRYLTQARNLLTKDLPYAEAGTLTNFRVEVEQHIGTVQKQQNNFAESETHYLIAEKLSENTVSETTRAFIYDDIAELYLKYGRYEQALAYAKRAELIWDGVKTADESHSWGTLACVYAGLGQDDLAHQYAQKVLKLPKPTKFVREQAYMALYQVSEHRQDWKAMTTYYKKYIAIRDTITNDQRSLELASIQKQAEFDRLMLENQQAGQLQAQRLLTLQKQAEVVRLRAGARADALTKKAHFSEQQRLLDNERAQADLNRQQAAQRLEQQVFRQQALQQQNQAQQNWILFISSSSLLLLGLLALLLYSAQLRKRKAETDLQLIRERKEADTRIIQTQEIERQRIATDLHDDLGGTLATLRRRIADLSPYFHEPQGLQTFADLDSLIRKSSDDLRRIAHNLMPPEFARIGLRHALEQLVRSQPGRPTHFSFVTVGAEQNLPVDTELNAYRIVSELLQNIGKHAHARRAAVQLLYHTDHLTITVEDDGLGNQVGSSPDKEAGIGLKSSSLRADYIGATLWREVSEAGTLVVLDVPYPASVYGVPTPHPDSVD